MKNSLPLDGTAPLRWGIGVVLSLTLLACELSPPPSPPASKKPAVFLLKFSAYAKNNALNGFFTLGDAATNQVAANGRLQLHVYTSTTLALGNAAGQSAPGGMKVKSTLYENSFAIGVTNFHWEQFGSLVTVRDLACHFAIPYANFQHPVQRGRVATIDMEFSPDGGSNNFSTSRNVSLY